MKKTPTVLLIMDGYGLGDCNAANAIYLAKTPIVDNLLVTCPHTALTASGKDVGLPDKQIGNSEVGHTNIGSGRVVYQDLPKINKSIENRSFFENKQLLTAMQAAKGKGAALHLMGLLSDGGVHSHNTHLYALAEMARDVGLEKIYVHAFLDGRDVPPKSGANFVRELEERLRDIGVGKIATIQGRFFAMDRDKRWDRVQKGYDALVRAQGELAYSAAQAIERSYNAGATDEFIEPIILDDNGVIKSGDSVIFFNFRPDRAREITRALNNDLQEEDELDVIDMKLCFVCMTQYDETFTYPVAFPTEKKEDTLGEYLSNLGLTQLRIAETEKYAHVTFFFNGGVEKVFPGEDRILVDSPREPATYDLIPQMSAYEVTERCVDAINSGKYDVIICNLANCDMVGHAGVLAAAISAVEVVDECVGRIVAAVSAAGGMTLVTADHGNADCMVFADGTPHTAHTTSLVPFIVSGANVELHPGRLCDIAPTLLELMGYNQPSQMTGKSLIIKGE